MDSKTKEWIKWAVWVGSILIGVIFWFRDEAKEKATTEVTLQNMEEKIDRVLEKQKTYDGYWHEQTEINGRIVTWMELDGE
jgi:hypothetical protein